MATNIDRKTLRNIARRTLGRREDDQRPISPVYITHLRHFLDTHRNELNFKIDLDNGDGAVFCAVCEYKLRPGDGEPEEDGKDIFGSMKNFEEHLKSSAHHRRKELASKPPQHHVAASSSTANVMTGACTNSPTRRIIDASRSPPISLLSSASSSPGQANCAGTIDEDYLLALKLHREINGPGSDENSGDQQEIIISPEPMDVDETYSNLVAPRNSASVQRDSSGPQEELPFEETYHAQIQGILNAAPSERPNSYNLYRESPEVIQARCLVCHFSVALPGSGSFEAVWDDVTEGVAAFEKHLQLPVHFRKRDGSVMQISGQSASALPIRPNLHPTSSLTPQSIPPMSSSSTGKRKLPGSWYDGEGTRSFEGPGPFNFLSLNERGGFTSASIAYLHSLAGKAWPNATNHHPHYPGSITDRPTASGQHIPTSYRLVNGTVVPVTGEDRSGMHMVNRPAVPLPASSTNSVSGVSSLSMARNFATRPFQESQAAKLDAYGSYKSMNAGDFNINYDDGGPVADYTPVVDADKRFKDFMNKALEEFRNDTTVTDAQKKLNIRSEDDLLEGMHVRLLPHQIIGVAWMVDQEKNEEKLGGILADAMGLGKTVQMIAMMAFNRPAQRAIRTSFFEPRQQDKGKGKEAEHVRRTTLVLAPASLLQQWYEEFDDKATPGIFRVHIHHGKDKLRTVKEIEEYDVIIASHQSVVMDFPKEKKDPNEPGEDDDDSSEEEITNQRILGPLAKVKWLRIVIDEAQSIRNKSTRLSTCVARLDSRYRWCLTGTPVTNTLADIYGFLRFCRFAPWDDWKIFNPAVARLQKKYPDRAGKKAQAILRPHLLRRTKDSTLDGRPIIRLGPKTVNMIELEFTAEERKLYESVEAAQKKIVSRFLKEGTVMKNYTFILVMILRLRQLCCHPKLITTETESEVLDANKQKAELVRAVQMMGAQKVEELKERLKARILHRMKAELGLVKPKEDDEDDCPVCMEPIVENRRVTSCAHEFCSACINEVLRKEDEKGTEEGVRCPLCRSVLNEEHVFAGKIFEPSGEELEQLGSSLPKPIDSGLASNSERPLKKSRLDGSEDSGGAEKDGFDFEKCSIKEDVESSTKMQCMLENIMKWKAECPRDKTIIYSQWTSMLDLVETYLKASDIDVLRYDGRMNRMARVESVSRFKKPSGPSVMLVSLKCGGVGLNLTVANRVINLDLAWNYATEAQAYDRVHRLGQQKPVEIQRFIVRGTIEERIIRLQAKKQGLSDAALGEGTGSKLQRMTARDIAQLFGLR